MKGILLINLGTPEAPTKSAVRRYLREFLSDPFVLDINPISRWFLVNFIIAPFRSPKSAHAYQKIWMKEGSPLMVHTRNLTQNVSQKLGEGYAVEMAMRYGKPSIKMGIKKLQDRGVSEITVLPLYPQYALSSTATAIVELENIKNNLPMTVLPPFFVYDGFIDAFAMNGRESLRKFEADYVLFSFHGLPERHVKKCDTTRQHCFAQKDCCERVSPEVLQYCYRAQCYLTAEAIAKKLNLEKDQYSVSFQSRLGRTPWIQPFTDIVIPELAKSGKKKLLVYSPSFVADCLETLEEIGIRAKESFLAAGGVQLELVPSLNSDPMWVDAVCEMVK